jgi:hypothetical protein
VLVPARSPTCAAHRRPNRAQAPNAAWRPYAVDASPVAFSGPHSLHSPSPVPRLALPHSVTPPPLPPLASSSRARAPASATATMRTLAELAVPATMTHRQHLHLPPSTIFSSLSPCSPWLIVVLPLSSVIARRRLGMLTGEEPLRGHLPSASPHALFSRTRAPHRVPDALERLHSPATTRAAALPCTTAPGFPSSLGHTAGTVGFAQGWESRRSSWPSRRPHRRRGHAG